MTSDFGRVLITGGLGFIGRNLITALSPHADTITVIDTADESSAAVKYAGLGKLTNLDIIHGDCSSPSTYQDLSCDYDYIFHMGAVLGIITVAEEPLRTMDVNIFGTRYCLDFAVRQHALKKFIFFSTSEVYGSSASVMDENSPFIIDNDSLRWCYAASKVTGEFYCKAYSYEHNLPYTIIRPFNVYGPNRYGSNAMTSLISRAINDETLNISGDGEQKRSWCHVKDFIQGVISAARHDFDADNCIFNIGNDQCYISMLQLAQSIKSLLNSDSSIHILGDVVPDVKDRCPDLNRAKKLLGYRPEVLLHTGIEDVSGWLKMSQS